MELDCEDFSRWMLLLLACIAQPKQVYAIGLDETTTTVRMLDNGGYAAVVAATAATTIAADAAMLNRTQW